MKLTRKQVIELNHILATTEYDMPISARFRYAVTHNIKKTKEEIDAINDAFPPSEGLKEFFSKRNTILTKYNIKKDSDVALLEEDARKGLDAQLEEINTAYKPQLEEANAIEKEKDSFLDETVEIDLKVIKLDDMPVIAKDNKYPHWDIWSVVERIVVE